MTQIQDIEARRDQVLLQLRDMRSLRRGSITEQVFDSRNRKGEAVTRGPYYVWSRRENGKTVSRRLKPGKQLEQARQDLAEYHRFLALCQELEELTERLGEQQREGSTQEKKRR